LVKKENLEELKEMRLEMDQYLYDYLDSGFTNVFGKTSFKEVHYEVEKYDQLKLPLEYEKYTQLRLF